MTSLHHGTRARRDSFFVIGPRSIRAAAALACLSVTTAAAMVGGAQPAEQSIARHVVLIVGGNNLCTGVAIAPDLVLTAAHCVLANGKYRLLAFEGRRPAVKDVASVAPHPQFSPRSDAPDLALVKLATPPAPGLTPAAFSERRVRHRSATGLSSRASAWPCRATARPRAPARGGAGGDRPAELAAISLVDPRKARRKRRSRRLQRRLRRTGIRRAGPRPDRHHQLAVRTDGEPVCGFVSGIIPLARYRNWIVDTAEKLGSPLAP